MRSGWRERKKMIVNGNISVEFNRKRKNKMIRKLFNFDFFYIYLFLFIFAKEKSFHQMNDRQE